MRCRKWVVSSTEENSLVRQTARQSAQCSKMYWVAHSMSWCRLALGADRAITFALMSMASMIANVTERENQLAEMMMRQASTARLAGIAAGGADNAPAPESGVQQC